MLPTSKPCLKKPQPTVPGPRKPEAPQEEHHEGIHLFFFLMILMLIRQLFTCQITFCYIS